MTTSRLHKYMLSSFVTQTHHCMEHTFTMEVTSTTIGPSQRKRSQKNDEEDDLPKKRPKKSPKLLKGDLTNLVCRVCTSTLRRGKIRKPYRMCKICGKEYCMTCKKNEMSRCNICRKKYVRITSLKNASEYLIKSVVRHFVVMEIVVVMLMRKHVSIVRPDD